MRRKQQEPQKVPRPTGEPPGRSTALPIEGEREYQVALEWRAKLEACLADPAQVGPGLDESTRAQLLQGYEMHLEDVSRRIAEYETARRSAAAVSSDA